MIDDLIYWLRYAWRLYCRVPGLGLWQALRYPCDPFEGSDDPVGDADAEASYYFGVA